MHRLRLFVAFIVLLTQCSAWAEGLKVGVFQGTFDPPHIGHLDIGQRAVTAADLDILYVFPMPDNPEKPHASTYQHRMAMVEANFRNLPQFRQPTRGMVQAFLSGFVDGAFDHVLQMHPGDQVFHVIGSDSVSKYPDTQRTNHARGIGTLLNPRGPEYVVAEDLFLSPIFRVLPPPKVNLSSTEIREAYSQGKIHWGVPFRVRELIKQFGLYRPRCQDQLMGKQSSSK